MSDRSSFHFISGFPRSGSTLLAALLSQNPAFAASFQSPVGQLVTGVQELMSPNANEGHLLISNSSRRQVLRAVIAASYAPTNKLVFDNNRRWCAHMALLDELFPEAKVIACVRHPRAVLDSFERLFQRTPTAVSRIIGGGNTTVYDRFEILMSRVGPCGYAFNAFREAFYGPFKNKLLILDYTNFVQRPALVMEQLHKVLSEPPFEYDFDHVVPPPFADEFDRSLGMPGLHHVKPQVVWEPQAPVLPPDLLARLPDPWWLAAPEV